MTEHEAIIELIQKWYETKKWAEKLICQHLNINEACEILDAKYRGKKQLGDTEWYYRTHGAGVDISKKGNKGGVNFDFGSDEPDRYRLREFMIKQLNAGELIKKYYRELLHDEQQWHKAFDIAVKSNLTIAST